MSRLHSKVKGFNCERAMLPNLSQFENFIDITNGKIRYYEAGQGEAHTLLLHGGGLTASADSFQFAIGPLSKHLHIYALDNLGSGKSTRALQYGPTFDVIIDGFREFMDLHNLDKVNIVGNGFGGWLGALLAYESPDRVSRLVILAGAGMDTIPIGNVRNYELPSKETILNRLKKSVYAGSAFTQELATEVADQEFALAHVPGAYEGRLPMVHQMDTLEIRKHYLLQRRMPHIKTPILSMWTQDEAKDPYPTWVKEWEILGGDMWKSSKPWLSPNMKLMRLPEQTNPLWESPETFSKIVIEFLEKG